MRGPRSLLARYLIFLAAVVAALATGAFLIVEHVIQSALEDLFRQRLARVEDVVQEYGRGSELVRARELEAMLGSPRFLAALETADPATLEHEVPTQPVLSSARLVVVADADGRVLWGTPGWERDGEAVRGLFADLVVGDFRRAIVSAEEGPVEIVATNVTANNGLTIGCVAVGTVLSEVWAEDLRRLTGFDVVLTLGDRVLDVRADHPLTLLPRTLLSAEPGRIERVREDGHEVLVNHVTDEGTGLDILFVASVQDAIAPLRERVRRLLMLLGAGGGLLAIGLVYAFTNRHVGRQLHRLIAAAERIGRGELDVPVLPGSNDELGQLALEFDRMREEIRRQRDEVEVAHQARVRSERMATVGQMAAGIVHDFKNPMAVVLGTTDLIEERNSDDPRLARQCRVIRGQVERMVTLTRDLLEYARGEVALELSEVDLDDWTREILEAHEEPFRRAQLTLRVVGRAGLRLRIDPSRMRRVVDNLLNNAREVSTAGQEVTLGWTEDRESVSLWVSDHGPGVPAAIRERLFEPFVTSGKVGGSGLGLAISRKITEDHGARLEVRDARDGGATFVIILPAAARLPEPAVTGGVTT
ncbi:MAG: HAMP domain-containing protein [Gemmatimonadetes bacterium]|nr:HAMP domain-containing protein [Gemmatimonadota bacterium]